MDRPFVVQVLGNLKLDLSEEDQDLFDLLFLADGRRCPGGLTCEEIAGQLNISDEECLQRMKALTDRVRTHLWMRRF